MIFSIDDKVCEKNDITVTDASALFFVKQCYSEGKNPIDYINQMLKDGLIYVNKDGGLFNSPILHPTGLWNDKLIQVLSESDKSVSCIDKNQFTECARKMRSFFPAKKVPDTASTFYKGNNRDVTNRLIKWWKIYNTDNEYTFDDIINVTEKYVNQCKEEEENGSTYSKLRTCLYFILKDERKIDDEGRGYVEQVSTLSNMLENQDCEEEHAFMGF